jgi:AraC-like DNA-binding protein
MSEPKADAQPAMPEVAKRDAEQKTSTIGSYSLAIGKALESYGVDSTGIFRAAGIPIVVTNNPMSRLPTTTVSRLYRACVEATNDPYFGLTVARFAKLSQLHALGHALETSATLMDFCRRLERYFGLVSQVANVSITEVNGDVFLRFEHMVEVCGETEDFFFGFLIHTMRQLYKPAFNPLRVEFRRPMPDAGAEPYLGLFHAPVTFSNATGLLVFDKADLLHGLDGSCPELAQINDNIVIGYLARLDKSDLIASVTQSIIEFLPAGDCSRDKVASALRMSPSTLRLKLSQRGTHFQKLLDDTRKDLACSYLRQQGRTVTEVTFLLGFRDVSNFTRAFKRWTGLCPTDFREQC